MACLASTRHLTDMINRDPPPPLVNQGAAARATHLTTRRAASAAALGLAPVAFLLNARVPRPGRRRGSLCNAGALSDPSRTRIRSFLEARLAVSPHSLLANLCIFHQAHFFARCGIGGALPVASRAGLAPAFAAHDAGRSTRCFGTAAYSRAPRADMHRLRAQFCGRPGGRGVRADPPSAGWHLVRLQPVRLRARECGTRRPLTVPRR